MSKLLSISNSDHPKIRWKVINHMMQLILSHNLNVGEQLPRTELLCSKLNISRTAVRDGIGVLATKGIVQLKPGKGATIQPISKWNLLDPEVLLWLRDSEMAKSILEHLLEIRIIIEPEAAALAAVRGTMDQFQAMSVTLLEMEKGCTERTPQSIQGDIDFHNIILETSGNLFLSQLKRLCMVSVELIINLTLHKVESPNEALELHKKLFEAIKSRQPKLARRESKELLYKTISDLRSLNIPVRQETLLFLEHDS